MLPYAAVISAIGIARQPRLKQEVKRKFTANLKLRALQAAELSLLVVGLRLLLELLNLDLQPAIYWVTAFVVLFLLKRVPRTGQMVFAGAVFLGALLQGGLGVLPEIVLQAIALIVFFIVFKLLLELLAINRQALRYKKKVSQLEEGDIVAETLYLQDGQVKPFKGVQMAKLIKYLRENNLAAVMQAFNPPGQVIVDSRSAAGLLPEQVKRLQQLAAQGKLEDQISLKKSAPLAPAILIGYVVLSLIGDLLWNLLY